MANFAPQVGQTQDPNYWYWSRPIQPFEGNKAGLYQWEAAGAGVKGLEAADKLMQQHTERETKDTIDIQRSNMTDQLEAGLGLKDGQPSSFSNETNTGGGVINPQQLPPELRNVQSKVQTIQNAKQLRADLNTYYDAQLRNTLKDLRSKYPGYRDYIDQAAHQALSYNIPANTYLRSLIQYADAMKGNSQKSFDETRKAVFDHLKAGNPEAQGILRDLDANPNDPQAVDRANTQLNKWNAVDYQLKTLENKRKLTDLGTKDSHDIAEQQSSLGLASLQAKHFNSAFQGFGINSASDIDAWLIRQAASGQPPDPKTVQALGMQLNASKQAFHTAAMEMFTRIPPGSTRSMMDDMGGRSAVEEKIKAYEDRWDTTAKLITDGNFGMAGVAKRLSDEIIEGTKLGYLTDADVGGFFRNLSAIRQLSPTDADNVFREVLATPGMSDRIKNFVTKQMSDLMAQPDVAKNGIVRTATDAVKAMKDRGITLPTAYNELMRGLESVFDPSVQDKELQKNIARSIFDPKADSLLRQFKTDQVIDGVTYPGYNTLYSRLGSQQRISVLKGLGDPQIWNNYVSWMGKSYGDIFQPEVQQLNKIDPHWFQLTWDGGSHQWGVHFTGDPTGRNILVDPKAIAPVSMIGAMGDTANDLVTQVKQSVNKLNDATRTLSNVVSADGDPDADAHILQHMIRMGLSSERLQGVPGIPQKLMQSIINSRRPSTLMQYGDTGGKDYGLEEYLKDPAAAVRDRMNIQRDINESPIPRPNKPLILPPGHKAAENQNLGDITGMDVTNVPAGVNPQDMIREMNGNRQQ